MDTLTVNANEGDPNMDEGMEQAERLPEREYKILMTPELAKEFLEYNTHNRKPSSAQIDRISRSLLLGEWRYNGEAIKRDWNGVILDGQNRLHAIVATGVPAEVLVVEGLAPETQETMDGIIPRSLAHLLVWRGEKDPSSLAAVLNLIHVWNNNGLRNVSVHRPTKGQALAFLDQHGDVRDAVRGGQAVSRKIPISTTLAATCWYRFSHIDEGSAEDNKDFWHAVTTGFHLPTDEEVANGDPGQAARKGSGPNLLAGYLRRQKARRDSDPQWVKHAHVVKAWNLYRLGEERQYLAFKTGGRGQEPFPEPI